MNSLKTQDEALWKRTASAIEAVVPSRELWTEPQLRRLVEKERFRAGRREIPFAFLIWEVIDDESSERLAAFARLACSTLRLTDEVGRWEDRIGTLLTDTDAKGATIAADKLRQAAAEAGIGTVYEMFVYPDPPRGGSDGRTHRIDAPHVSVGMSNDASVSGEGSSPNGSRLDGSSAAPVGESAALIVGNLDALFVRATPIAKRLFDIVAALGGLIVLSPFLLAIALAIRLNSRGPAIFTQVREGRGGRNFTMYKFRTMVVDAEKRQAELRMFSEQDGPAFKMTRDPRLTSIGRFLRKTTLDEVPQLINVLKGEMSIVGPRPLPVGESHGCRTWQRRRLDVLPGMTCSWQAQAARQVTFDDWMRLDLRYAARPSLPEDLRLIARTVVTLVQAKASV